MNYQAILNDILHKNCFMKNTIRYIFTLFIISIMVFLAFGSDDSSDSGKVDYDNIKTQEELNKYVQENATDKCEMWQRACANRNETRRWQEQVYVDETISNFMLDVLPTVVQNNNLPNSYIEPAKDIYLRKLKECGYSTYRSEWPK